MIFRKKKFDLQITIDRVHPVPISSRNVKNTKNAEKRLKDSGVVPTIQPEKYFSQ